MNQQSFNHTKQEAIKRMQEMQAKSMYKKPEKAQQNIPKPTKPPPQQPQQSPPPPQQPQQADGNLFGGFNLPFLESLKTDSDLTLILGILLLLLSEKADKRLLFALIYILL